MGLPNPNHRNREAIFECWNHAKGDDKGNDMEASPNQKLLVTSPETSDEYTTIPFASSQQKTNKWIFHNLISSHFSLLKIGNKS
jgi:hypothetical protein